MANFEYSMSICPSLEIHRWKLEINKKMSNGQLNREISLHSKRNAVDVFQNEDDYSLMMPN